MNHKLLAQIVGLTLIMLLVVACGASQSAPTSTAVPHTPTPSLATSVPMSTPPPTHTPESQITLYYEENAQFELISPQGTRVLIDVFNPSALTSPVTENDILLTTHGHPDHIKKDFINSFPGQQLRIREGEINLPDVTIRGIAAAHTAHETDKFKSEGGSNYIFIVDMGELRIVHFGDIGQDQLTREQLDALGKVDIALTQLENSFSQMNLGNKKGFNLMTQVKPKLIIPTHGNGNMEVIEYATGLWQVFSVDTSGITIGRSDLSDETELLVMGQMAPHLKKIYSLPEW
jgi:L-ascorbate metabolism protein UlaG (beta-lactamase superfamily)